MANPRVRMEVLGHFGLWLEGQRVSGLSRRGQQLLAWLALHRDQPQTRAQIAFLLWPDSREGQAQTNLRRELHQLRQQLPGLEGVLHVNHTQLEWQPQAWVHLDAAEFEAALARGTPDDLAFAVGLYRGDVLPDCYDDWVTLERERLHQLAVLAHERRLSMLEAGHDDEAALQAARRLLELEPCHEGASRSLMRLHARRGERAAALHAYHRCVGTLDRELSARPAAETEALYRQLFEAALPVPSSPTPLPDGTALVGRAEQWTAIQQAWRAAAAGRAGCLLIAGEAGIGKTRLAAELLGWCRAQGLPSAHTRCYAAEGRLAFAPVRDWLRAEELRPRLEALAPVWLAEIARLLPEYASPTPPPVTPDAQWQRQLLFEALARGVLGSGTQPLLLVLDDIQWCDPDTLEWLHYLLRQDPAAPLLLLCTLRSEERQDNAALVACLRDLRQLGQLAELELGPLNETQTAELAGQLAGAVISDDQRAALFRSTEGHPLFVVEMARSGLAGGAQEDLPPRVQAVIAARLAQLSPEARELAALAAIVGREVEYEVLREASDLDESQLVGALDELWRRRIIREHGPLGYDFSHDRLREVSVAEPGPLRRRLLHRRVAQALELHGHGDPALAARLAHHHEQAGQPLRAIAYHEQAAQVAMRASANEEAVRALQKALSLLERQPASPARDRHELILQRALSQPLVSVRGYSSVQVEAVMDRLGVLGEQLDDPGAVLASRLGRGVVAYVRGDIRRALTLSQEARQVAEGQREGELISEWAIGVAAGGMARLRRAHEHLCRAIQGYDPARPINTSLGPDLAVFSLSYDSHVLWLLGRGDQALQAHRRALALAGSLPNPFNLTLAHAYGAVLYQLRGERDAVRASAQAVLDLCAKYGFAYYRDWGLILSGWADHDPARLRLGLAGLHVLEAGTRRPYYLGLLVETHLALGQPEEARPILDAALATAAQHEDAWWTAELRRLQGELSSDEDCLRAALDLARAQESRALELRAALSLAWRWQAAGRTPEATALLEPIYRSFREGLDTSDLHQARTLLDRLTPR